MGRDAKAEYERMRAGFESGVFGRWKEQMQQTKAQPPFTVDELQRTIARFCLDFEPQVTPLSLAQHLHDVFAAGCPPPESSQG